MVLIIDDNKILGNSFKHKSELLKFKCQWDSINKYWLMTSKSEEDNIITYINNVNEIESNNTKQHWLQACKDLNLSYVKKGSQDYDNVLKLFKISLNS